MLCLVFARNMQTKYSTNSRLHVNTMDVVLCHTNSDNKQINLSLYFNNNDDLEKKDIDAEERSKII